jgi:hypothetical protein
MENMPDVQARKRAGAILEVQTCPPHWYRIAIPRGPVSKGRCRKCRETRLFKNYADWELNLGNWATMPKKGATK